MKKITCLITSGGTKVKIDMVRHIGNMSRGTFGSKIAYRALDSGLDVTFLYAKDSKEPYVGATETEKSIKYVTYETFDDYYESLMDQLEYQPDIIILAAAVSDYGVENYVDGKIRSSNELIIKLKPLPKLIGMVRKKCPNSVLCGFKLLVNSTQDELNNAIIDSIHKNKCDLVIGNDLRDIKNNNHILTIGKKCINGMYGNKDVNITQFSADTCILEQKVINYCLDYYDFKQQEKQ